MSTSVGMAGRGILAAAVVAGLACLGLATPATASAVPRIGSVGRASGPAAPGFASGNLPPALANLSGISCPTASFCMAVGSDTEGSLAQVWNGSTWAAIAGPPGGGGVSCGSAQFCMTINGSTSERWNGRTWTAARLPSALGVTGFSCVGASFCMAVGLSNDTTGGGGAGCMTSAVWRGIAWHTAPIPFDDCGVPDYNLGQVSCVSPSDCVTVGMQDGDEHIGIALAAAWNGTSWQLDNLPTGNETPSDLWAVSCSTTTAFCMALGNTFAGNLALSWDGTGWTELSTSPPSGLYGMSCATAASCAGLSSGQPMTWNGTAWTSQTIAQPAGANLNDVSCWQASGCMAVGQYGRIALPDAEPGGQAGAQLTVAEQWNGSTWQVRPTPSPGDAQEGLSGLSCPSAGNCMAVGAYATGSDVQAVLAEQWNGGTWKVLAAPDPGPDQNALTAVSCPAAKLCIAVGYDDTGGSLEALAEQWNGSTWTTLAVPQAGALTGVSCPAAGNCVAVGSYLPPGQSAPRPLSATWNGSTWTIQTSPDPGGAPAELNAVTCPTRTRCIAAGDYQPGPGLVNPLTALWNGSTWTTLTTRAPGGANGWNTLTSVACSGPQDCMAVGTTFHLPGQPFHPQALTETWNGTRWTVRPTPQLKDKFTAYLDAVSCPAATRCRTVGGYLTSYGTGFMLAEAWNGKTWRRLVPLTDPSPTFNGLYAISCPTAYHCIATGETDIQHSLAYLWNGTTWRRLTTPSP